GTGVTTDTGLFGRYTPDSGVDVYVRGADGTLALAHNTGRVYTTTKLDQNRWYFVTATWTGSTASLYLDGDLVGKGAVSGAPAAGATNFEIGALGNGLATTF